MHRKIVRLVMVSALLFTTLFVGGAAYADDPEDLPQPGLTPDSPFYFLDKLGKNITLTFTFGAEAKAKKALRYAEERLSEADAMAAKNKVKHAEDAAVDYDALMAKVMAGLSDNVSEQVARATAKHLEVLARVMDRASGQAKDAIERAREKSINGQLNALKNLAKNHPDDALDISEETIEKVMKKIKASVADNVTSDNATSANVSVDLDYAERIGEIEEEILELAEEKGIDVTALLDRLSRTTSNRLETLAEVYGRAPEQARHGIANAIENSVKKYERALDKLERQPVTANVTANATAEGHIPQQIREKLNLKDVDIEDIEDLLESLSANTTVQVKIQIKGLEQEKERPEKPEISNSADKSRGREK